MLPPILRLYHHLSLKQSQLRPQIIRSGRLPFQIRVGITRHGSRILAEMRIQRLLGNNHHRTFGTQHIPLITERCFQPEEIQPIHLPYSRQFRNIPVGRRRPNGQQLIITPVTERIGAVHPGIGIQSKIIVITVRHRNITRNSITFTIRQLGRILKHPFSIIGKLRRVYILNKTHTPVPVITAVSTGIPPATGRTHLKTDRSANIMLFQFTERMIAVQLQTYRIGIIIRLIISKLPTVGQQTRASGIGGISQIIFLPFRPRSRQHPVFRTP